MMSSPLQPLLKGNGLPVHCAEQILYFIHKEGYLCIPDIVERSKFSLTAIRNNINRLRRRDMIELSHKESKRVYFKISKSERLRMKEAKDHFLNHI